MADSFETKKKIEEYAQWWDEHKNKGMDLHHKVAVQAKMIEGLFTVTALLLRDIQDLKGMPKNHSERLIYVPGGFGLQGKLH